MADNALNRPVNVLCSLDVLLLVAWYLSVKDICRLAMVCRALNEQIEGSRVLWLRALHLVEIIEALPPFSYIVDSMDVRSLKGAACAPYRLGQTLLGKQTGSTTCNIFHLDTFGHGAPPQHAMHLLPGGRWLIHSDQGEGLRAFRRRQLAEAAANGHPGVLSTETTRSFARISCSDLSTFRGIQPCISFDLSSRSDTWPTIANVRSDPANRQVLVVVSYLCTFPIRRLEVLRLHWPEHVGVNDLPVWDRCAKLDFDSDENVIVISLEADFICVTLSSSIIIWKWTSDEWTMISFQRNKIRGAILHPPYIHVMDDETNEVHIYTIPPLISTSQNPSRTMTRTPIKKMAWKDGVRVSCEVAVLENFKPPHLRPGRYCAIIYWSAAESGIRVIKYGEPHDLQLVSTWESRQPTPEFGVHSAALQTVDMQGVAIRVGRRFLARLTTVRDGLVFRVRAFSPQLEHPRIVTFPVHLPAEWNEAETYDSCTILGRVLLRQYDSSSDSESSEDNGNQSLAVLDFIY